MPPRLSTIVSAWLPWWMPANGALHGHAVDRQMIWNLAVLSALFAAALALIGWAVLMRTQSSRAQSSGHWMARWSLAAILGLCALFAGMSLTAQHLWSTSRGDALSPDLSALQVEVVGVQFQWYFRYPGPDQAFGATEPERIDPGAGNPLGLDSTDRHAQDDFVASMLVLPVGRTVDLRLRALDVIHGFFIPGMRLKQNAVPGLVQHIHFTSERSGDYPIVCTQVCGLGHYRMQALLRVVSQQDFDRWLKSKEHVSPLTSSQPGEN